MSKIDCHLFLGSISVVSVYYCKIPLHNVHDFTYEYKRFWKINWCQQRTNQSVQSWLMDYVNSPTPGSLLNGYYELLSLGYYSYYGYSYVNPGITIHK